MLSLGNAPLRIARQAQRVGAFAPDEPGDEYFARLVKLIPAEAVALYLTFKEVASSWLGIWAWICLGLVVLLRSLGTRSKDKPVQWAAVFIAVVSFVLWIYATGGYLVQVTLPTGVISAAIGVWTVAVPYVYKGSER